MTDTIETLMHSTIQHGPLNRRIYLMKLNPGDVPAIIPELSRLASRYGYGKILAKIPESVSEPFRRAGYQTEALIPDFFISGETGLYMSLYFDPERIEEQRPGIVAECAAAVAAVSGRRRTPPEGVSGIRECSPRDAPEMSRLYRQVFATYPFPIHDPAFIERSMAADTRYFCIRQEDRIAAIGSCEMDLDNRTVEMTDFAVAPESRGKGLAAQILARMEAAMARRAMRLAFTISRSASPAMNIVFKQSGYHFAGALLNNTHIAGRIETMWVWYKPLADSG